MNALAHLIKQRAGELRLLYKEIAQRSEGTISAALISKWMAATTLSEIPQPRSLLGLARALQLPPIRVIIAAGQAAGMDLNDPYQSTFAGKLPPAIDQLTAEQSKLVLAVAWQFAQLSPQQKEPDTET